MKLRTQPKIGVEIMRLKEASFAHKDMLKCTGKNLCNPRNTRKRRIYLKAHNYNNSGMEGQVVIRKTSR